MLDLVRFGGDVWDALQLNNTRSYKKRLVVLYENLFLCCDTYLQSNKSKDSITRLHGEFRTLIEHAEKNSILEKRGLKDKVAKWGLTLSVLGLPYLIYKTQSNIRQCTFFHGRITGSRVDNDMEKLRDTINSAIC